MRLSPLRLLLVYLKGDRMPDDDDEADGIPKEQAYSELKHLTGQDFGMDAEKWERWIDQEDETLRRAARGASDS